VILDVKHLEMMRAIDETRTLTEAARRLFMSQPALSRQLAKLERRIGAKLFHRRPRGMVLTQEGVRLLESAERVLGELSRAERDVQLLAQGRMGTVRVTTECYMCYHWLPWVARRFAERFPQVEVQLAPEETKNPYGALQRGAVDVALVFSPPPPGEAVERAEVFEDELVALVPAAHALAGQPFLTPDSVAEETLICHYAEPGRGVLERDFLDAAGVSPRRTMEMLVTPAVIEMARAGYGVAVLPRWILGAQGSLEGLVVRPLGERGLHRTWYAAYRAAGTDEPVLRSILEALHTELGGIGPAAALPNHLRAI
jgi:LysR family transcriptional regulator for metE and metH